MVVQQEKEALEYFNKCAKEWGEKAAIHSEDFVNITKQRNDYVLKVALGREKTGLVLDVGCGTGELVIDACKQDISAVGIDFAQEMIDICEENAKKESCAGYKFLCSSIFDSPLEANKYDVIAANGFIEYIPYDKFYKFLEICFNALTENGSLVLSSRNRLFNIFSLNKFTQREIDDSNFSLLMKESLKITNLKDLKELFELESAPLQKEDTVHPKTGINVSTRYQFTPLQLMNILKSKGFETEQISPIHIHGVLPSFKDKHPKVHAGIANLLQTYEDDLSLVPNASSFMIHARKCCGNHINKNDERS